MSQAGHPWEEPPVTQDGKNPRGEQRRDHSTEIDAGFWREYLAGAPTVIDLPRSRQPDRGEPVTITLSRDLTAGLRALACEEGVTLDVALIAAFAALLYRYTGQEELLIGSAVSGRKRDDEQGMTVATAAITVLRADMAGQPTVSELLRRVQAATDATRGHEAESLDHILDAVGGEPSDGHRPLAQVLLAFEPIPGTRPPQQSPATQIARQSTEFDLVMTIDDESDALRGLLAYDGDLFDRKAMVRMVEHWRLLLEEMVSHPQSPVDQTEILTRQERQVILSEWSSGGEVVDGPDITEMIALRASTMPDAVAVQCGEECLTYHQLNHRANKLACLLQKRGVWPEIPVGVCLGRSPDYVAALLGILKSGGAYVPLDPEAPSERIRYVLEDSQMSLVVTDQRHREKVRGANVEALTMDGIGELMGEEEGDEPRGKPKAEQLGYVIYTSGSTGQPKGVMVERGALSAHSRAMIAVYGLEAQDRVLQFSQYSADASLEQILCTLGGGGRLVMRGSEIWTPRQLLDELKGQQVTVMNLSPSYFHQVVRDWALTSEDLRALRLRLVILGGERLTTQAVQAWQTLGLPGVRLVNAYGPTEATITATLGDAGDEEERITIGRPLPGRHVHILDKRGRPVPIGVVGELHIGGPLLARGYLNRPELTDERFVLPNDPRQHDRMYKTGDLVRHLDDGRIDYVGREDEQVQIRGYRIELGEVEAVLEQHPAVAQAVVVAQGDGGERGLVAYVVARTAEVIPEDELWRHLEQTVPRHMQPTAIAQLAAMPRLATGKPDRRRLPPIEPGRRRGAAEYHPPRRLAEQQLVRIWEELLEPRPIGVKDNFFHLGGHSLLAAQLVHRIEQVFGRKLALSTLFAGPTVEQIVAALDAHEKGTADRTRVLAIQTEGSRQPFFFLHGDWTGGAFYCFALSRACGPEQPFSVLEPCTFSSNEGAPTLVEMARAHIGAMRGVQAFGPYRLGGFCNGGLLAYEMARQLEAEGEQVEFLALINPSEPVQRSVLAAVCGGLSGFMGTGRGRQPDLYLRVRHALRHLYRRLRPTGSRVLDFAKLVVIDSRLKAMFPPTEALYHDYVGVFSWAAAAYRAGIYGGRITFFWARDEPEIAQTWRTVTENKRPRDVEEHMVAGTHMTCITDGIDELAESLRTSLSRLDPPTERPSTVSHEIRETNSDRGERGRRSA